MKIEINLNKVRIIYTPQGEYLKTLEPYKYAICKLPEDYNINKKGDKVTIEVEPKFYRKVRLYRFEDFNLVLKKEDLAR